MFDLRSFVWLAWKTVMRGHDFFSVGVKVNGRKHLKKKLTKLSLCISASEVLSPSLKQCSRSLHCQSELVYS